MKDIGSMTDAELVEAVAREVMGYGNHWYLIKSDPPVMRTQLMGEPSLRWFRPFTDMNDLFMVLDKLDKYRITKGHNNWYGADVWIAENVIHGTYGQSLTRAALEAALSAERVKE